MNEIGADKRRWGVLNAFQIKLVMMVLMVLNHLVLVYDFTPASLDQIFLVISRCVAPMFGYLLVEGIFHTHSLPRFCLRLAVWSAIVTVGDAILGGVLTGLAPGLPPEQAVYLTVRTNITITLAAAVTCLACMRWACQRQGVPRFLFYVAAAGCFIVAFYAEWGMILMPFMLVSYLFRGKPVRLVVGYALVTLLAVLTGREIFYFLVYPFILLYNGKRGPGNALTKYLFYVFYPVHLWVISLVNFFTLT